MKSFLFFFLLLFAFIHPQKLFASYEDSTVTYVCVEGGDGQNVYTEDKYIYYASGNIKAGYSYTIEQGVHNLTASSHYEYEFDSTGNLLTQTDSSWGFFTTNSIRQFTYDTSGRVLTYNYSNYFNGMQRPDERTEYMYDISGNLVMETFYYGLPLDTNKRTIYEYDANDYVSSKIVLLGSPLVPNTREINERNASGKDTLNIAYHWNGTAWDDSIRTLSSYQTNDTIRTVSYVQHPDANGWVTVSFDTLNYDVGNFIISDYFYEIDSGVIDTSSRYIYTYTSQVPLVYHFSEDYYYTPNFWEPEFWNDYIYDLRGNLIYGYGSCYGCGYGESNYAYDTIHNLLIHRDSYSISHGGIENSTSCDIYFYDIHGEFTICQTDTLTLHADTGFVSYQWSTGETTSSIRVYEPGNYTVSLTDSTGFVWEAAPHIVAMKAPPVASHGADSTIYLCRNENGISLQEIDLPSYNYQWLLNDQPVGGYNQNSHSLYIGPNVSSEGNYRVRVSNECGFDTSSTTTIHFSPSAVPGISHGPNVSICQGDTLTITATGGSQYNWIPTFDTTSSIQVVYPGVYQVRIFDTPGCYATQVCTVSTVDFSQAYIRQQYDSVLYYYNYGNGYASERSWLFNGDTIAGAHSYNLTVSQNGIYSLILTSSEGCVDTLEPYNYVLGGMTLFAGPDVSKCSGTLTSVGVSSDVTHGIPPYSYTWLKDGSILTSGISQSGYFQTSFTPITTVLDTIVCVLTVIDSIGTTVSDTQLVVIYPLPSSAPVITGATMDSVCRDVTSLITASPPGNYRWYHDGIPYSSVLPDHWTATNPASYTCSYIDVHGCVSPQSLPYIIYSHPAPVVPVITVNGTDPTCWGDSIQLVTAWDSSLSYTWAVSGNVPYEVYLNDSNVFYARRSGGFSVETMNDYGCTSWSGSTYLHFDSLPSFPIIVDLPTVLCYGDSVRLGSISYPGYTYQWMRDDLEIPGATDTFYYAKATGYYFLKITNSLGCSAGSDKWLIQARPENTITVVQTDSLFTADALFTSTFQWYNDSIFLIGEDSSVFVAHQSGEYLVEVTDYHGCVDFSDTFPIDCHLQLTVNPVLCHDDCNGILTASSNAINPYTMLWSTGDTIIVADSLCAGTYWVKISDAWGCTDSISYTLINPDPLQITIQDSLTLNCFGNCDTLNAIVNGGYGGYTYQWSNGSSDLETFVCDTLPLSFSVIDMNGCDTLKSVMIFSPVQPVFTFSAVNPSCVSCPDGMLTIYTLSGTGPFTVIFDSMEYTISNAGDSLQLLNLLHGNYDIQVVGDNGCIAVDSVYLDGTILSAASNDQQYIFHIIPNPATSIFSLVFKIEAGEDYNVEILDYSGKIIFHRDFIPAEKIDLDGSAWSKGIYTVRIVSPQKSFVKKLILN